MNDRKGRTGGRQSLVKSKTSNKDSHFSEHSHTLPGKSNH
jgi:hypothetical protein